MTKHTGWLRAAVLVIPLIGTALALSKCGSDGNSLSEAAPALAVSSPTASSTSARGSRDVPEDIKPIGDMVSDAKADFNRTPTEMVTRMGTLEEVKSFTTPCYGPTWTDNATGSSVSRPSGDLGIIYQYRDGTSNEACAAAKMNALIGGEPHLLNKVRMLVVALLTKASADGLALPAVGGSITVTMPTVADITFTEAKLERLTDDADGNKTYKTSIMGSKGGKNIEITLYHTPTNADNTEFKGLMQAVLPHSPSSGAGTNRGISAVYQQTGTTLKYIFEGAANRSTASTDFFDATTGRVKFSGSQAGENLTKMIAQFDTSSGAATVHYAWQAGASDGAARVFAVTTSGHSAGATGIAYFGFGAAISSITDSTSTIWATKMYCNWLSGLAGGTSQSVIQKQTMTFSSDMFQPATNAIAFAPTDTCAKSSNWTISSGPSFKTSPSSDGVTSHSLTTYGSDFTAITAPTYTIPSR